MRTISINLLLLVPAIVSCGGDGRGTIPTSVALSGRITVPELSVGDPEPFDGDAFHARSIGELRAEPRRVAGGLGPPDRDALDVLRVGVVPGSVGITLTAEASLDAVLHVLEARTGREAARAPAGRPVVLRIREPDSLDLVVESNGGAGGYEVRLAPSARAESAAIELPLADADPGLRSEARARYLGAHHEMVPGEVLVVLSDRETDAGTWSAAAAGLATVRDARTNGGLGLYRLTAESARSVREGERLESSLEVETCVAARRLAAAPGVVAASPNYVRRAQAYVPNDPLYALQWHFDMLRMELAWELERGSSDVVVGIVDTGIVSAHPDVGSRLVAGYDFISDPSRALDGDGVDPDPEDPGDLTNFPNSSWHGTHVAGTIGASTDNGVGVAGMDHACRLAPLRALGRNGGTSIDILEAVRYAAGLPNVTGIVPAVPRGRVDVLNLSLGGGGGSAAEEAIYAQARQAGVLIVCAAGNDATDEPQFPASYPTNLSIGAVRFDGTRAFYSNRASTVDVMAPGGDTTVDMTGDSYADGVLSASAEAGGSPVYVFEMGTSMACPHVAGLASLLLASRPGATPAELEQLILQNTEDLGAAGVDPVFRFGLIDPLSALRAARDVAPTGPILTASPLAVSFGDAETSARVTLSNVGNPATAVEVTGVTIEPAGATWLFASLVPSQDPSISHRSLELTVDRTGLSDGDYSATVRLMAATGDAVTIAVSMQVGDDRLDDTVFVVLVDIAEFATIAQDETSFAEGFAYLLDATPDGPIPDGTYLLVAGTDRDGDDFLGDEGELFGVWPLETAPVLLELGGAARVRTGLDFPIAPVTRLTATADRGYRRIR